MFDPQRQLFVYTLRRTQDGLIPQGVSPRYTLMTLLGLHRYQQSGGKSPFAIAAVLEDLLQDLTWVNGIGDLGLLLWTVALTAPHDFADLEKRLDARRAPRRYRDARRLCTMELAWYLTGLSYGLQVEARASGLAEQAEATFVRLIANQGGHGVFGHQATEMSLGGWLRGKIGSFADQVYPIYALTQFSKVSRQNNAVARALQCARSICRQQGGNGEWWWHYDASTGKVAETYPVYSVHQDGMAPMALQALAEASGEDFTGPLGKGLEWIGGQNDLQYDMRSQSDGVIWRCFDLSKRDRLLRQFFVSDPAAARTPVEKLHVNFECRPYELGWALYALSGK